MRRSSILPSNFSDCWRSNCSSFSVSFMISSNSFFLASRCFCLSAICSLKAAMVSFFNSVLALSSLIFFSANSISNFWNSSSLTIELYSRLLRTLLSLSAYFEINSLACSMVFLCSFTARSNSARSLLSWSIFTFIPAISLSRSSTSKGNSPRTFLISSILESMICKSKSALSFSSTLISFFLAIV